MTETANHTLELLRTMRGELKGELGDIKRTLGDLADQARIVNAHIVGLVRHENLTDSRIAELQLRVERLERAAALSETDPR